MGMSDTDLSTYVSQKKLQRLTTDSKQLGSDIMSRNDNLQKLDAETLIVEEVDHPTFVAW